MYDFFFFMFFSFRGHTANGNGARFVFSLMKI